MADTIIFVKLFNGELKMTNSAKGSEQRYYNKRAKRITVYGNSVTASTRLGKLLFFYHFKDVINFSLPIVLMGFIKNL